ncbi:MAG: nucleoside monophosphate kinase [Chlamydiota bacterium]
MEKFRAILLLGPPGSGKGSIGTILAYLGMGKHLSSGDIFRQLPKGSSLERGFREQEKKGLLLPDEQAVAIFLKHLNSLVEQQVLHPAKDLLILDGLPRTVEQVDLIKAQVVVETVVHLKIRDQQTIYDRIEKRARKEGRPDDQISHLARERVKEYERKTVEILNRYPPGILVPVFADLPLPYVCRDLLNKLLSK